MHYMRKEKKKRGEGREVLKSRVIIVAFLPPDYMLAKVKIKLIVGRQLAEVSLLPA